MQGRAGEYSLLLESWKKGKVRWTELERTVSYERLLMCMLNPLQIERLLPCV